MTRQVAAICQDMIDTPISPELLPACEGELQQRTEDILGDYALHDFFLYHHDGQRRFARESCSLLAMQAFHGVYADGERATAQLETFLAPFLASSSSSATACPTAPRWVPSASVPRGDWRMPSDANRTLWQG